MKSIFLALSALFLLSASGAPEDWFVPVEDHQPIEIPMSVIGNDGKYYPVGYYTWDPDKKKITYAPSSDGWGQFFDTGLIDEAIKKALEGNDKAQAIAENLDALLNVNGIEITPGDGSGSYTVKFGGKLQEELKGGGGTISATSDASIADQRSLDWTGANNKLEIAGFNNQLIGGYLMDNLGVDDLAIPVRHGGGIMWMGIGELPEQEQETPDGDGKSIEKVVDDKGSVYYQIKGWQGDRGCNENLLNMLTSENAERDRDDHEILCRYQGGRSLHYVSLGKGIFANQPDEFTIKTNSENDEKKIEVALLGPLVKKEEDGKKGITLDYGNGLWLDEEDEKRLAVKVDNTLSFDRENRLVVNADAKSLSLSNMGEDNSALTIAGWYDSLTTEDLYTMLTSEYSLDCYNVELVARYGGPGGTVSYVPIGDALPMPDEETIMLTDDNTMAIKPGEDGKFMRTIGDKVTWDYAVSGIYLNDEEKELDDDGFVDLGYLAKTITLNGESAEVDDSGDVDIGNVAVSATVNGNQMPVDEAGDINLGNLVSSIGVNGNTILPNADGFADLGMLIGGGGEGGYPGDNQSIQLGLSSSGATNYTFVGWNGPHCGETLHDLMTKEDHLERSNHELVCRYSNGDAKSIHYLPLGDVFQLDKSLEYGEDKKVGIKPGNDGEYLKTEAGKVTWAKAVSSIESSDTSLLEVSEPDGSGKVTLTPKGGGGSVDVAGTSGNANGSKIRFESMPDSDVKINVVKNGDEIVVQIGVYYK